MYAVLFLNNSWEWSGGYSQYLYWAGHGEVPMPNVAGWDAFRIMWHNMLSRKSTPFVPESYYSRCKSCQSVYWKKYSEDPAIMSWQIGNEPRPFGEDNKRVCSLDCRLRCSY